MSFSMNDDHKVVASRKMKSARRTRPPGGDKGRMKITKIFTVRNISEIILITLIQFPFVSSKTYKGAELRTDDAFLYGRFEVRMKSAAGSGLLSSFFTYHDTPNIPAQWNEIDIEILGRVSNGIQYNIITQGQVNHVVDKTVPFNPHQAFHVYGIEWTPDYVAWLVDGYEVYRETGSHIAQLYYGQKNMMNIWPPDNSGWVGILNPASLPVYAFYDWVKYYDYTPGTTDNFTLRWADEFDFWNQGRWSKGTHTWYGNLCDFIAENAVFQDGYLILCLTDAIQTGYSGGAVVDSDIDPPYLVWSRNFGDHITVFFSEELESSSAQNSSNYILPNFNIISATLLTDNRTVRLEVDSLVPPQPYNLIVSGVSDLANPPNTMGNKVVTIKPGLQLPISVNIAGNNWQSYLGDQIWKEELEYGYTGGRKIVLSDTLQIQNSIEDEVYRSECRGVTFYQVRLPQGNYNLTFMFAETEFSSITGRIFDVYAEGQQIISGLNIFAEAGLKKNYAVEKTVTNIEVNDGILDLYFEASLGEPVVSGLKIERTYTGLNEKPYLPSPFFWDLYPNPFNATMNIEFSLDKKDFVRIELYNIRGQLIKTILSRSLSAGKHSYRFRADDLGSG
ncbi:MAG: glycosyl hydrolase family protein, partial [Calditrichaeota bacterium]